MQFVAVGWWQLTWGSDIPVGDPLCCGMSVFASNLCPCIQE